MRAGAVEPLRSDARSPRFRRIPFARDVVCDHGGAAAPRISVPPMLPSSSGTISAPTSSILSRLNTHPMQLLCTLRGRRHRRNLAQHSLSGGRYPLPGQDFHLLDSASLAWRTPDLCSCYARRPLAIGAKRFSRYSLGFAPIRVHPWVSAFIRVPLRPRRFIPSARSARPQRRSARRCRSPGSRRFRRSCRRGRRRGAIRR